MKNYEEKLKLAKEALESGSYDKETIEYIFPELVESGDEKMFDMCMKALDAPDARSCIESWGINPDNVKNWLKKQKEQKPTRDYSSLEITSVVRRALQECEEFMNYRADVYAARVGAIVELLLNEQKPVEWSEEDEHRRTDAIYFLETTKKHYASTIEIDATIEWLKSLKSHPHWKPSENQVEYVRQAIELFRKYASYCPTCLIELYEDLKKL